MERTAPLATFTRKETHRSQEAHPALFPYTLKKLPRTAGENTPGHPPDGSGVRGEKRPLYRGRQYRLRLYINVLGTTSMMLKCWQTTREDEEIEQLWTGEESKRCLRRLRMLLFQMPCPCIFRVERLATSFNRALKFLVTHGMFGRNVLS